MRIIGGHDYYDSGLAWGQDETVIFVRNKDKPLDGIFDKILDHDPVRCGIDLTLPNEEVRFSAHKFYRSPHIVRDNKFEHAVYLSFVVVCGTLYRGFAVVRKNRRTYQTEYFWIWTSDAFRKYAKDHNLALHEGTDMVAKDWVKRESSVKQVDVKLVSLDTWVAPAKLSGPPLDFLIENRITVASKNPLAQPSNSKQVWNINSDTLGAMGFAKAVDPYTVFQEISMWNGGVLSSSGPPMVEITDDKIKIAKHGFHHPTSFRRPKAEKHC